MKKKSTNQKETSSSIFENTNNNNNNHFSFFQNDIQKGKNKNLPGKVFPKIFSPGFFPVCLFWWIKVI